MPQAKTAPHTLCEPAQSKRMSRFHKTHFIRKFTGTSNMPQIKTAPQTLCVPAQSKHMSRFHKTHFLGKFTGKMPQAKTAQQTLCVPAQSKRMSRFLTLYGNLQGQCHRPKWAQNADEDFVQACAVEAHVKISQELLYTEIYRENAAAQSEHPDQAPAFTLTVRTPQWVWTHCLGNKKLWKIAI